MRFLRKRLRLSQQRFAEDLGEKRGKIAAYEEHADARPEFYKKVADSYNIDLHKFLTTKMTEETYPTFFNGNIEISQFREPEGTYYKRSEIIHHIQELKKENDPNLRLILADKITSMVVQLIEENGDLRKEIVGILKNK